MLQMKSKQIESSNRIYCNKIFMLLLLGLWDFMRLHLNFAFARFLYVCAIVLVFIINFRPHNLQNMCNQIVNAL